MGSVVKPLVFYFLFSDPDTDAESTHGFFVDDPRAFYESLGASSYREAMDGLYDKVTEEIESDFGVHDRSSAPNDAVDAIGYTTYEVSSGKIPELMNTWREVFVRAGCDCSSVATVPYRYTNTDLQIYRALVRASKQPRVSNKRPGP
jgi:hypothetical protein